MSTLATSPTTSPTTISATMLSSSMSRCSLCNTPISEVGKENVLGKVPDGVYDRQDKFWFCEKCDKYYWAGSHWEKIIEKVEEYKRI